MVFVIVGLVWMLGLAAALVLARAAALGDRYELPTPSASPPRRVPTAQERFGRGSAGVDGLPTARLEAADAPTDLELSQPQRTQV